ncbi:MAG: hypothetical protein WC830_19345 [Burkholderiales bacterium]|jgi:hypothetical protein
MNSTDAVARFGFLPEPVSISFGGVCIEPLPDHAQRLLWYKKNSNVDGFFYPPQVATYEVSLDRKRRRKLPRTTRPASVYHLPASHTLSIQTPREAIHPYSDSVVLIQLLAFIFGTRLQFEEWRFDGRVPSESTLAASATTKVRIHFVEHAYAWWKALSANLRVRAANLFYAFNRATAAEWEWDAFYQQYMVFDGLFRMHADMSSLRTGIAHKDRFTILCDSYGIPLNEELVDKLYDARNGLFHEAMWAGAMIGHPTPERDAFYYPHHMARLNARILCAITGYRNTFTSSVWWAMGRFHFPQHVT